MDSRGSMTREASANWLKHFGCYKFADPWLLVFDGATSHLHHSIVMLHTITIQQCSAFQVRIHMNFNLWTNLSWNHFSINRMNRFCCFITITAQIALSPSTDWAIYSLKHGIKQPHQPTLSQDSCHWYLILQSLDYWGQNLRSQFCNTQWGRPSLQSCDSEWHASSCSCVTEEGSQVATVPGASGKVAWQPNEILVFCLPAKIMTLIRRGKQSLHLHRKHGTLIDLHTILV